MEENHRYQRDADRLAKDNALLVQELRDQGANSEYAQDQLQRVLADRSAEAEQLHSEVLQKAGEVQRLQRQAREAEGLRRDLLGCREQLQKTEQERNAYRDKCGELEIRVTELNELLNLELAKGYDSE